MLNTEQLKKFRLSAEQDETLFLTERLQLAVFLHATGRLRLLTFESSEAGRVMFVFEDPDRNGEQAELEFDRGANVSATNLFASQKYLRRKMTGKLNNQKLNNQKLNNQNIGVIDDEFAN